MIHRGTEHFYFGPSVVSATNLVILRGMWRNRKIVAMMVSMKLLFVLAMLAISLYAIEARPIKSKVWFMYFMKGDGPRPTDAAEGEKMQADHIKNMQDNAKAGKLFAAGPLQDPTQMRRGITVVKAETLQGVKDCFLHDPYVQGKIMTIATVEWDVDLKRFHPAVDPSSIVEHRLVVITRGKGMSPESPADRKAHDQTLRDLVATFHGVGGNAKGDLLYVSILVSTDTAAIETALRADPLIRRNILQFEILPLWMSKGVVE